MHLGIKPDNPIERLVLSLNVVPEPLIHTQKTLTMVRTVMDAKLTSASGTWSVREMGSWMTGAGLRLGKTVYSRSAPGTGMVWGEKI